MARNLRLKEGEVIESFLQKDVRKLYGELKSCGYTASDDDIMQAWLRISKRCGVSWRGIRDSGTNPNVKILMTEFDVEDTESTEVGL